MDSTANLLLPFIMPSQAQKHVTHNAALATLDALVMLSVESRTETAPPQDPAEGERHIVAPGATGDWSGRAGRIASFQNGGWEFLPPREGWRAWCAAEDAMLVFSGGAWRPLDPQTVPQLGVNATPDETNRLAVASEATLLTHEAGSHRLVVNKAAPADTASIVFQDGYSGRAEIGLAGDDRLSVKVSADGETWTEALTVDGTTGKPAFPAANILRDFAVNLYQDSGRFAGNGSVGTTIGAYAFPAYLTAYSGTTHAALGKFIHNNNDYGGSAGALDPQVRDLIERIRDPADRRYGVEFWVSRIAGGDGGSTSPIVIDGVAYSYSLFTTFTVRPPAMTFHAYVRVLDSRIVVKQYPGQTIMVDGVATGGHAELASGDGWVSVTVFDEQDPFSSNGYNPGPFNVYAVEGEKFLLACPALMGGITGVDDNVGIIAGANSWAA